MIVGPAEAWAGTSQVYSLIGSVGVLSLQRQGPPSEEATWAVSGSGAEIAGPATGNSVVVYFNEPSPSSADPKLIQVRQNGNEASKSVVIGSVVFETDRLNLLREAQASNRLLFTPADFSLDPAPILSVSSSFSEATYDNASQTTLLRNLIPRFDCDPHQGVESVNSSSAAPMLQRTITILREFEFTDLWNACYGNKLIDKAVDELNSKAGDKYEEWHVIATKSIGMPLTEERIKADAHEARLLVQNEILARLTTARNNATPLSKRISESTQFTFTISPALDLKTLTIKVPLGYRSKENEWFAKINREGWDLAIPSFQNLDVPIAFDASGQTEDAVWNFNTTFTIRYEKNATTPNGQLDKGNITKIFNVKLNIFFGSH
jgi:hypothetical protein